jgi:hypothetical protein
MDVQELKDLLADTAFWKAIGIECQSLLLDDVQDLPRSKELAEKMVRTFRIWIGWRIEEKEKKVGAAQQ